MNLINRIFRKRSANMHHRTPEDKLRTFVGVGYPKTGNTWLRMSIGRYLQMSYGLPEMPLMDSAEFQALADHGCKVIGEFTHYPLEWTTQRAYDLNRENTLAPFDDQRVVLLVRHPLDTLVSQFMQERFRNQDSSFDGKLIDFIEDPIFGLQKLIAFYSLWAAEVARSDKIHVWRYETAKADPTGSLRMVLRFFGEHVNEDALDDAVEFTSFENMRLLENSNQRNIVYRSSGLYVFGSAPSGNPNAFHVRKGIVGGYKDEMNEDEMMRFESIVRAEMPQIFGYS